MTDELISREALIRDIHDCVVFSGRSDRPSAEIRGARKILDRINVAPTVNAIVLPCKVGDTVYMPHEGKVHKLRVQGISVSVSGNDVVLHFGGYPVANVWGSEIDKTVFLTREEAEKALEGREDNG